MPVFPDPVFLDVDTQIDFLFPTGALYVPGAERFIPTIARLNAFAIANKHPLISTVCDHTENDAEFAAWPPHCITGTVGQLKPEALRKGQRLFTKQSTDLFASPNAEPLLSELAASDFVVYGVVTEVCVQAAAFGLLARGKNVAVVRDAVHHLSQDAADAFFAELIARGGRVVDSFDVLS